MTISEFNFTTFDNIEIKAYKHIPDEKLKAVVLIIHGMAEHAQRYSDFAKTLCDSGYAVFAYDQRGHGKTAGSSENLGFFAEKDGWKKVTDDVNTIIGIIEKDFPGIPIFLFGHSMGSFIARTYITEHSNKLKGVVLSGSAGSAGLLGKFGIVLTKIIITFYGKKSKSPLLDKLSFGEFNKAFKPNRTAFDWLSRDNEQVDRYVNDPFCGTVFTAGFFLDLFKGLENANKFSNAQKVSENLPIYLFSGNNDPVSKGGKQIQDVCELYKKAGISDVTMKLYTDGRHEMLNEINKNEVYKNVITWLDKHL